jgi:hypothetical protein
VTAVDQSAASGNTNPIDIQELGCAVQQIRLAELRYEKVRNIIVCPSNGDRFIGIIKKFIEDDYPREMDFVTDSCARDYIVDGLRVTYMCYI